MFKRYAPLVALAVTVTVAAPFAQKPATTAKLMTPKEQFGHDIGDDYYLANSRSMSTTCTSSTSSPTA